MDIYYKGNMVLYKPTNEIAFINDWGKDTKNNYYIGIKTLNTIKIIPINKEDAALYIEPYKCAYSVTGFCNYNNAKFADTACSECRCSRD